MYKKIPDNITMAGLLLFPAINKRNYKMLIKDTFIIESKENKTGTSDRGEWSIDEYLILNKLETNFGSILETYLTAVKSQNCPEVEVGGIYDLTIFVGSQEYKGRHYPKFRITAATLKEKAAQPAVKQSAPATPEPAGEQVNVGTDDIPF
jgi:hypothetical protein